MPVIRSLMKNLNKQYGGKKGKSIYYAMENKAGGSQPQLQSALKKGAFNHNRKNDAQRPQNQAPFGDSARQPAMLRSGKGSVAKDERFKNLRSKKGK